MFTFSYKPYAAIIGDIVDSRGLRDRKTTQEKLVGVLNEINDIYSHDISSRFMVTLGDEFQGLLHNGAHIIEALEKIERDLFPVKARFGIGIGEIVTEIKYDSPFGADGSAYYNARKIIDMLKTFEKKKMGPKPNIGVEIESHDEMTMLINSVFSQNTIIKAKITPRQREVINVYLNCGGTQNSAAQILGISQSTVQKALNASGYYTCYHALQSVTKVIEQIMENYNV